jgi:hypothetical protein
MASRPRGGRRVYHYGVVEGFTIGGSPASLNFRWRLMSKSATRSKIDLEFDLRIRIIAGFELAGLGLISAKGGSTDTTSRA